MKKRGTFLLSLLLFAVLLLPVFGEEHDVLRLAAPPEGLLAPPLLRMVETQPLAPDFKMEFRPWKNQEQMRALVLSGGAEVIGLHTAGAALFQSKGVPIRMLGLSLNNVLSVLATQKNWNTWEDLAGKNIATPFKDELPDILLRAILDKTPGLESRPRLRYVASSRDGANLLAGGRVEAALVAEPHASILLEKAGKAGIPPLYRSVNLQKAWDDAFGTTFTLPSAGVAALGDFSKNEAALNRFWKAYVQAVDWCLENPEKAAQLSFRNQEGEPEVQAGIAGAIGEAMRPAQSSAEARPAIAIFLELLRQANPEMFGTVGPSEDFFFAPLSGEEGK